MLLPIKIIYFILLYNIMFLNNYIKLTNALANNNIEQKADRNFPDQQSVYYGGYSNYFDGDVIIGDVDTDYNLIVNGVQINNPVSSNALITGQPLVVPSNGTIFTSDGASAFECVPQQNLNFKNDVLSIVGSTISTNNLGHMAVHPIGANMDVTGNISVINGNSLIFKNGIDANDIQIYQANNQNGSLNIKNNVGSTDEFTGASAYNFDNTININGVPVDIATINRKLDAITTLLYNLTGIQIS